MEKRELTCIGCPLGCTLTVTMDQDGLLEVSGNTCKRGDAYARKEVTHPTRIVTSTIKVSGGTAPIVSCKTKSDIPKDKIFDCIKAISGVTASAPISIGDILLSDAAGTGIDVIATKDVAAAP